MDKILGVARCSKERFWSQFGGSTNLDPYVVSRIAEQLDTDGSLSFGGERKLTQVLQSVSFNEVANLDSRLPYRVKSRIADTYIEANRTIKKLTANAQRTELVRRVDNRFPKLKLRHNLERVIPGITGLTENEIKSFVKQFVAQTKKEGILSNNSSN